MFFNFLNALMFLIAFMSLGDTPIDTDPTEDVPYPDLQLLYRDPKAKLAKPVFTAEVGFSQPGRSLEDRAKQLLQKTAASVVVIFDVKETPRYRNHFKPNDEWHKENIDIYRLLSSNTSMEN